QMQAQQQEQARQAQNHLHQQQMLQQLAMQEHQQHAAELLRRQQEAEAERICQADELQRSQHEVEQQHATQERRNLEQQERLDDLYQEYGPASAEQHEEDLQRRRRANQGRRQPMPPGGRPYQEPVEHNNLGLMNVECSECHALHFDCEKLTKSLRGQIFFGMCCLQGLVKLPALPEWPATLRNLFQDDRDFKNKIRQYNSALAFTSLGVEVDRHTVQGSGPAAFRIHGALYHLMGSLLPPDDRDPTYAQLRNPELNPGVLLALHDMMEVHHPYVNIYKQAYQVMREKPREQHTDVRVQLHYSAGTDIRRYNLPTANEIAAVIPGDGTELVNENRDIVLRLQGGGLRRISHLHQAYSALHYVLLFPKGEEGWHLNIPLQDIPGRNTRSKSVTQILYYAYRLH
ncbi:hypothetical protein PAXINDRAFT_39194, partial [Paxillus involutus ATCC 200175]